MGILGQKLGTPSNLWTMSTEACAMLEGTKYSACVQD
jgi:hypothetical protein